MDINHLQLFEQVSNLKQLFFDAAHPVGEIYVQYPQQKDPNELYKADSDITCEWVEQTQYNGCFFRSTNAPTTFYCREGETEYYRDVTLTKPINVEGLGNITVVETVGGISTCQGDWTEGHADDYIDETGGLIKQLKSVA